MFHKISLICFILIFICLYLYVKIEAFTIPNTIPNTTQSSINNIPINTKFDNVGLYTLSDYATSLYKSVPNDTSLTNFYKLGFDSNFNIVPKLEQPMTIAPTISSTTL